MIQFNLQPIEVSTEVFHQIRKFSSDSGFYLGGLAGLLTSSFIIRRLNQLIINSYSPSLPAYATLISVEGIVILYTSCTTAIIGMEKAHSFVYRYFRVQN
jgi:hypothetical protein